MAITIIKQPESTANGSHYLNGCIDYVLNIDDVGDGTTNEIRVGYQLLLSDGTPATKEKFYAPPKPGEFTLSFNKDYRRFMEVVYPNIASSGLQGFPNCHVEFKLKYWEIEYDLENCTDPVENNPTETGFHAVSNAVFQSFQSETLIGGTPQGLSAPRRTIMHNKPKCIPICKDGYDFFYVCGVNVPTSIVQEVVLQDGTTQQVSSQLISRSGIARVGPNVLYPNGVPNNAIGWKVTVSSNGLTEEFEYPFKCDCGAKVIFQEHEGGFSMINFCKELSDEFVTSSTEICIHNESSKSGDLADYRRINDGFTRVQNNPKEYINLELKVPDDGIGWRRWINNFLASQNVLIVRYDIAGREEPYKFIIEDSQYVTFQDEVDVRLVVRGKIEQVFYLPQSY